MAIQTWAVGRERLQIATCAVILESLTKVHRDQLRPCATRPCDARNLGASLFPSESTLENRRADSRVALNIKVPAQLREALQRQADERGECVATVARDILRRSLEQPVPQLENR